MMVDNSYQYSDVKKPVNLRLLFAKYLRYWYWFVIAIGISLCGAYFYLRSITPIYQINSVLLIKKDGQSLSGEDISKSPKGPSEEKNIENEIETLKSRSLIQRVVDDLNLTVAYFQKGEVRKREEVFETSPIRVAVADLNPLAYQSPIFIRIKSKKEYEILNEEGQVKDRFPFNRNVKNEYGNFRVFLKDSLYRPENNVVEVAFSDKEDVIQDYQASLKVELINQKSTVLKLGIESSVPAKGKAFLGKLMEDYAYTALTDKNREATNTLRFIDDRLKLITGELSDVEKNFESYKTEEGITDLSTEGNSIFEAVKGNDAKLNDVDIQLQALNGVEKYLKSSVSGAAPAMAMANDPVLTGLLTKLSELQSEQEKYNRTTQPGNPFRQTIEGQIANTKNAVNEYVANQRQNLLVTKNSLKQLNGRLSSSIKTIPRKEREFLNIKRQQAIKESLYLLLLEKKEETAISYASAVTDSRVMDRPYSSPYPIKPNRSSIYLLALFAGLLIPMGFISAGNVLNDKVKSRREIEAETGIQVFGEIVKKPKQAKNNIIDLNSHSMIAEQFKIIRANLQYASAQNLSPVGQVVLITSSVSGEGKSFVSINLALSMALLNKKAIVLELDLRKPQIAQYLGMANSESRGISNYLSGQADYDGLVQQTQVHPNLYVIPSGPIPHNPTELLSNGAIEPLLTKLREEFDYIILDTPPVSMLADATLLSPYVDTAFYVIRHEYTPRNYMRFLADLRDSHRFKSLNVIVNAVNYPNSEDFGYGYSYAKRGAY
ncbi:GumC family protein [Spirosoma soli]|uniref:non-specific protein-tyrosine kinase n=1 Tax=Spirosoma soli TaxID=1770529 RepID=A0ABW5M8M5_9BACT